MYYQLAALFCLLAHITGAVGCSEDDFTQVRAKGQGVYLNCEHLDIAYGLDLEACILLTCQVGGNGFNFRISPVFITQCYPKRCCGSEAVYAHNGARGGYEVYLHNDAHYGCPLQHIGNIAADVVPVALAEENTGEVTAEGCSWRGDVHPAGETWIQNFCNPDKHMECVCPDPLPRAWSSLTACRGVCYNNDTLQYGGDKYERVIDGVDKTCRCSTKGKERCK